MDSNTGLHTRGLLILSCAGIFCALLLGCGGGQQTPAAQAEAQERRFALRGTVVSIDRPEQRIVVDHEEIPGFMAAMAMPYPVAEPRLLDAASPGDQITADVVVTDSSAHLENIVVVKKAEPSKPGGRFQQQMPSEGAPSLEFAEQNSVIESSAAGS